MVEHRRGAEQGEQQPRADCRGGVESDQGGHGQDHQELRPYKVGPPGLVDVLIGAVEEQPTEGGCSHTVGPAPQPASQHVAPQSRQDQERGGEYREEDRKSTRLNSSHANISYAVFCLKKKKKITMG